MTVTYQVAQILANYQGVEFKQISYDETTNIIDLWTYVILRPWPLYWNGNVPLSIFTVLELQDVEQEKGKRHARTVKMIKSQRDWFEFSPFIRVIPFVGDLYANYQLRFLLGNIITDTVTMGLKLLEFLLLAPLAKPIFG